MPMHIEYEKHTLKNGLDVILHEDHSIPTVAVNVWYHVGSRTRCRAAPGFAHLFEHVMFEGSKHHNREYFEPLQGGRWQHQRLDEHRPHQLLRERALEYLELALWLESDRMGFLLDALDDRKFEVERDVVKNERRQSYENRPYGMAGRRSARRCSRLPPLQLADHRLAGPPGRGLARRREGLLPPLLLAEQRQPGDRGRHRRRRRRATGRAVLRRPAAGAAGTAPSALDAPRDGEVRLNLEDRVQLPALLRVGRTAALRPDEAPLDVLVSILAKVARRGCTVAGVPAADRARCRRRISPRWISPARSDLDATVAPGRSLADVQPALLGRSRGCGRSRPALRRWNVP